MKYLIGLVVWMALLCPLDALGECLRLRMVDVGMAECMIVTVDGEAMVIDTAYVKNADEVEKVLEEMDVDAITYLVLTHPHADHIGGTRAILGNHQVHAALLPPVEYGTEMFNKTMSALEEHGVELIYPEVEDQFSLGGATITIYGPHPVAYANANDWSIVLMIEYAGKRILLTGDVEAEAEWDMLAYTPWLPLGADILKVAHHGSDTSSSYGFVEEVAPEYAIISCGDEEAEYPHVETAMTLMDCGVRDVLTTKVNGDIIITIYENGMYTVSGQRSEQLSVMK